MEFCKFLRTKHIFDAGGSGVSRDDLLMNKKEAEKFLQDGNIVIEEKIDGANIGISIDKDYAIKVQNRSHFVNSSSHKQFSTIESWIEQHSSDLFQILDPPGRYILFGEWLFAKHSIYYTRLPDYFLGFDIFDVDNKEYLSLEERNKKLNSTSIKKVETIATFNDNGLTKKTLLDFLETTSNYYDGPIEGIVLRKTGVNQKIEDGHFFSDRSKLVRADFLQNIEEQWTRQKFVKNRLLNYY